MSNWTDETGFSWYRKLECKRCLQIFEVDERGEIPEHDCLGGRFDSHSPFPEYHIPRRIHTSKK